MVLHASSAISYRGHDSRAITSRTHTAAKTFVQIVGVNYQLRIEHEPGVWKLTAVASIFNYYRHWAVIETINEFHYSQVLLEITFEQKVKKVDD